MQRLLKSVSLSIGYGGFRIRPKAMARDKKQGFIFFKHVNSFWIICPYSTFLFLFNKGIADNNNKVEITANVAYSGVKPCGLPDSQEKTKR